MLISLDTLRADRLGCYGYERDTSPGIDAFATGALLFEDSTSAASNTAPSHMSMLTGLRPPVHGVFNVGKRDGERHAPTPLSPNMPTLAEQLAAAGFRTSAFTDGGYLTAEMQFDRGFQLFVRRPQRVDEKVDAVLEFLAQADRGERQFVFVHTYEIHAPYVPPLDHDLFTDAAYEGPLRAKLEALRASGKRLGPQLAREFLPSRGDVTPDDVRFLSDLYDGGIHFTDSQIARLLQVLCSPPWSADTAVILTSDHGEAFSEHGALAHGEVHRNVTHVPLIVRAPGLAAGRRLDPAAGVDLVPTALDLLGLPAPDVCDGVSLLSDPQPDRLIAAYNEHPAEGGGQSLRRGNDEIVRTWASMPWRRFDLADDPNQQKQLSMDSREGAGLTARAEQLLEEQQRVATLLGQGQGEGSELSAETLEQLEALGYLGGR